MIIDALCLKLENLSQNLDKDLSKIHDSGWEIKDV